MSRSRAATELTRTFHLNGAGMTDAVLVTNYNAGTMTRYVWVVYYNGGMGPTSARYSLTMRG